MDHLREVSRPNRAGVDEAVFLCARRTQRVEDRHRSFDVSVTAADHQAVTFFQTPDAARHTGIDERDALVAQQLCVWSVFGVARVSAVDDQVARTEFVGKCRDGLVGDASGRHHHPHHPRCGECFGERRECRHIGDLRPRVVPDHLMSALTQAFPHVETHFAQADETQLHVCASFVAIGPVSPEAAPASTGRHNQFERPGTGRSHRHSHHPHLPGATPRDGWVS